MIGLSWRALEEIPVIRFLATGIGLMSMSTVVATGAYLLLRGGPPKSGTRALG